MFSNDRGVGHMNKVVRSLARTLTALSVVAALSLGCFAFAVAAAPDSPSISRRSETGASAPNADGQFEVSPLLSSDGKPASFDRPQNARPPGVAADSGTKKLGVFGRLWGKVKSAAKGVVSWVIDHADKIAAIAGVASLVLTVVGTVAMFIPGAQPIAGLLLGAARITGVVAQVASAIGAAKTVYDATQGKVSWKQAALRVGIEAFGFATPWIGKGIGKGLQKVAPAMVKSVSRAFTRGVASLAPKGSAAAQLVARSAQLQMTQFERELPALLPDGLTLEEFNRLRQLPAHQLTDDEVLQLMMVRDRVPPPTSETMMQKVIYPDHVDKYMSGEYDSIRGYVTRAEDVADLRDSYQLYEGLRLDYDGNPFNQGRDPVYAIRFQTNDVDLLHSPYGATSQEAGLRLTGQPTVGGRPFTGTGFTASQVHAVPEFRAAGPLEIIGGAELVRFSPNGTEKVIAVYQRGSGFIPK